MEGIRIRALLIFALLIFPLSGSFAQNTPAASSAVGPEAQTGDPHTWDFGLIKESRLVKHEFPIKNNSDKVLKIKDVSTSCGCTASEAGKKLLQPGESTQLSVEFNSKGYKGATSQFVYVSTDDPVNPITKFTVKAFVQ